MSWWTHSVAVKKPYICSYSFSTLDWHTARLPLRRDSWQNLWLYPGGTSAGGSLPCHHQDSQVRVRYEKYFPWRLARSLIDTNCPFFLLQPELHNLALPCTFSGGFGKIPKGKDGTPPCSCWWSIPTTLAIILFHQEKDKIETLKQFEYACPITHSLAAHLLSKKLPQIHRRETDLFLYRVI